VTHLQEKHVPSTDERKSATQDLQDFLASLPDGKLDDERAGEVLARLSSIWPYLEGSDEASTTTFKLGRAENLTWKRPLLTFELERHGWTVMGSSRAELHYWAVDLDNMKASITRSGHRQLYPQDKRLNTRELAEQVMDRICAGEDDPWLSWKNESKTRVSLNLGKIIPESYQRTTAGRRRRFRNDLESLLPARGWVKVSDLPRLTLERVDED
jgi:hypothetical protein